MNKVISREYVEKNYIHKDEIYKLYKEYEDTGHYEVELVLKELLKLED